MHNSSWFINLNRRKEISLLLGLAATAGIIIFFVMLYGRIGILPAASTNDDIWINDPAYFLLKQGTLRRAIHDDLIGSSIRDFYPPVAAVFTAAAFSTFGITQFGAGFGPAFATTLGIFGFAAALRNMLKTRWLWCFATSISIFFLPDTLKYTLYNRFEPYVFCFLGISFWLSSIRTGSRTQNFTAHVLAGLMVGGAAAAHYPVAPFVWVLAAIWLMRSQADARSLIPFAFGTSIAAIAGLLWVWPDVGPFFHQLSAAGAKYPYAERIDGLIHAPLGVLRSSPDNFVLMLFGTLGLVLTIWAPSRGAVAFFGFTVVSAFSALIWWPSLFYYGGISLVFGLACVFSDARAASTRPIIHAIAGWVIALFFVGTVANSAAVLATAHNQREERNFEAFKANLIKVLAHHDDGVILVDRPAHLALRDSVPDNRLFYTPQNDQSMIFASRILADDSAGGRISAIISWPELIEMHKSQWPVYAAFLKDADGNQKTGVAVSPFGIGPGVSHRGPYHVIVFFR
jgi:hypothetical protein